MEMQKADEVLARVFGFDSWRPGQREIVEAVLSGRDALAILPTGGGKSLCYQLPAVVLEKLVLVVSPLIALMKDQLDALEALGVGAAVLNSSLDPEEYRSAADRVRSGQASILYAAPEALATGRLPALLAERPPARIVVDEAHCISQWGHDFRPDYRRIADLRNRFPAAACLAVTATATDRVRADIAASLALRDPLVFVSSFDRPALLLRVEPKTDSKRRLIAFAKEHARGKTKGPSEAIKGSGIVYCLSRKSAEEIAALLSSHGIRARPYHAGLSQEERKANQEAFIRDDVDAIAATVAFGMGIDKPDVRWIVHWDLPKDLEGYYQEIGRAGRDGLAAECLLLYGRGDLIKLRRFLDLDGDDDGESTDGDSKWAARERLEIMASYAETERCRRRFLLSHFGEDYSKPSCDSCDNCLRDPADLVDLTVPAQKLISCVVRLGNRFGAAHATDVLLGSNSEKIERYGHGALSTYGIGTELNRAGWMELARRLVASGHLESVPPYGVLRATAKGRALFAAGTFETRPIEGDRRGTPSPDGYSPKAPSVKYAYAGMSGASGSREKNALSSSENQGSAGAGDEDLFERLRTLRKAIADKAGVPPYVVFPDRTLRELSRRKPRSVEDLEGVFGVGAHKAERYGSAFVREISAWSETI